jgi:hypothetical protein
MRLATGDVIGILHTDDVWEPGVLKRVWDAFQEGDGESACGTGEGRLELEDGEKNKCERPTSNIEHPTSKGSGLRPVEGFPNSQPLSPNSKLPITAPQAQPPNSNLQSSISHTEGVYGDLLYVDADDITKVKHVWNSGAYHPKKFYNGWMPPHPALFVTLQLAERVGEYRLDLGSAADYEWMLRACLIHNATLVYLPETLVRMRVGGQSNASVQGRVDAHAADGKAWSVNGLQPKFWTLKMKVIRKLPQWGWAWLRSSAPARLPEPFRHGDGQGPPRRNRKFVEWGIC